jgi:hypothetical protein
MIKYLITLNIFKVSKLTKEQITKQLYELRKVDITQTVIKTIFYIYIGVFVVFQLLYMNYWGEFNTDTLFSLGLITVIFLIWNSFLSKKENNLKLVLNDINSENEEDFYEYVKEIKRSNPKLVNIINKIVEEI